MRIGIPYQERNILLQLPHEQVLSVIQPAQARKTSEYQTLRIALKNQLDSEPIKDFLREDSLLVVNDASRATPTARILKVLRLLLSKRQHDYIISTGTHRATTEEELKQILGENYSSLRRRTHIHDCNDNKNLRHLGKTSRGTDVYVNRLLVEAKRLLIIGSVEPHYFAGYTGGRKSLIPGLAGFRTIEQNHKWALSPDSQPLRLEGNPVHDDLMEAIKLLDEKKIFSIQTVLDKEGRIYAAYAGDLEASFRKAVEAANRIYVTRIKEKAEVIVTVAAPPLDANLYQAHKAIEHGKLALKKGGTIILVAACPEGIGPSHFYNLLASVKSKAEIPSFLADSETAEYTLGLHKAVKIAQLLQESEIWAMTEMQDSTLHAIHIRPIRHLQSAVMGALEKHGSGARIVILTDGATCVPKIK